MKKLLVLFVFEFFILNIAFGQCGSDTPLFTVDLSNDPNAVWTSPSVMRNDTCCGPEGNCIQFIVTLNENAEGVIFNVIEGAIPGGALFYQIECGMATNLNEPICLFGEGPHSITFCKPGNNENVYSITSVAEPSVDDALSITEGCTDTINTIGFEPSTMVWQSVFPGVISEYDPYLDCTIGCENVLVTPAQNPPEYIDYQVCGFALGLCDTIAVCDTVRVYFYDSLQVAISPINPMVCFGGSATTITANVSGGNPPFHYMWSTGDTTQSIDVGVGNYSVTVLESTGCYPVTASVAVGEFYDDISAFAGDDQYICNQSPNIQLEAAFTGVNTGYWYGGEGSYLPDSSALSITYQASSNEIDNGFVELWLITTNTANCPPDSDMVRIEYIDFTGDISAIIDSVSCAGLSDASIELVIEQGFDPFDYLWDDPSASTDSAIYGLAAGDYTVLIVDSLYCDTSLTFSVFEPEVLLIDSVITTDLLCSNDSSGSASGYASGGTPPYTYNWYDGVNFHSGNFVDGLYAGALTLTVEDANSCQLDTVISLLEPSPISILIDSIADVTCFGGSDGEAMVSASGGTGAFSFYWNAATGFQTGPLAIDLSVGYYTVSSLDENLCVDSIEVTIEQPEPLVLTAFAIEDVSCNGGSNGVAEVTVTGGTSPYYYLWDSLANDQITAMAVNLSAGVYSVSVSDSNNCAELAEVILSEPDSALQVDVDISNITCFGTASGSVNALASGGTAPYSYLWDENLGSQTSPFIQNVQAGAYYLWVNDNNNCLDSILFTLDDPPLLTSDVTGYDAFCFGGNSGYAQLVPSGGTPPYAYLWDDAANNQTSETAFNLYAGEYNYVVTDSNNCLDSGSVIINEPEELLVTASEDITICVQESVEVSAQAQGGTGNYTYYWLDFGEGQVQTINVDQDLTTLVQAIDSLGCQSDYDTLQVSVINIFNDSLIVINGGAICEGESSTIEAIFSGTGSSYVYNWNQNLGSTFGPLTVTPTLPTFYTFTISDQCSNTLTDSTFVNVFPLPEINIDLSATEGCPPLEVTFSNISSSSNFSYIWLFGNGQGSTDSVPTIMYEDPGNFLVQVQIFNGFGCSSSSDNSLFVNVFNPPVANFIANPTITDIDEALIEFTNYSSEDALFFTWNFGDGDSAMVENPSHEYTEIGEFLVSLEVENIEGCIAEISKTIRIDPVHDIIIPNVFTPNSNGSNGGEYDPNDLSNDVFYPFAEYVSDFHMMIFNRWGELVFESKDINVGWDGYYKGEHAQLGEYVYKIDLRFVDGYEASRQGKVKILR